MSVLCLPPMNIGGSKDSSDENVSQEKGFFGRLLQHIHPTQCLAGCYSAIDDTVYGNELDTIVPSIVRQIRKGGRSRLWGLKNLYDLTNRGNQQHRVPLVCTAKWDIISLLSSCIASNVPAEDRRHACLVLGNLTIPHENKAVLVLNAAKRSILFEALLGNIRRDLPESYICCACLMNLSYLEDGRTAMLRYAPNHVPEQSACWNPKSFIRTVESMMKTYQPFVQSNVKSVEGESTYYAVKMLRNLSSSSDFSFILGQTDIPSLLVACVQNSSKPLVDWTPNSLEDLSLLLLLSLAEHPELVPRLRNEKLRHSFRHIIGKGGIHDLRASFIACRFDEKEK